jgi:glycosyltransferase involved in cell wall biosynthesis
MLGWEFPPFISGGLGTACYGLTKAMSELDIKVTFVLPKAIEGEYSHHINMLNPNSLTHGSDVYSSYVAMPPFRINELTNVIFHAISSPLHPYETSNVYEQRIETKLKRKREIHNANIGTASQFTGGLKCGKANYSGDMYAEVHRYAKVAAHLASNEHFDIIHAHDWMTYPAGISIATMSGKPLIVHVHSTEFDRNGERINQMIYAIERKGMHTADKIITVSYLTRNIIIRRYGLSAEKVKVVHNGVERNDKSVFVKSGIKKNEKIVLFLGRITMQKGPEYFLKAAKRVLEVMDDVKFVMAGSGDLMHRMIEMAAQMGIGQKVFFTGFLRGDNVQEIYRMADLFVMPSVSEPFGLVPLEALSNDTPVIISKQSGVSEVLTHVLKVDFWDVEEMANKIIAVLKYSPLKVTLQNHGNFEVRKLSWKESALKCVKIYEEVLTAI